LGHAAALQCRLDDASRANAKCAAYVSPLEEKIVDVQADAHTRVLETESDDREEIVVSIARFDEFGEIAKRDETRRDGFEYSAKPCRLVELEKAEKGAREREMGRVV
tara:strand:+ start:46197 stop:46517 length:321 start_codon:yes stop_codon:yes gene_type:complete